jgi:membrane-associated protein
VAGDALVPVFPGESAVVAAAVLAADGELIVWLVLLAAFAGAFVGRPRHVRHRALAGARLVRRGVALIVAARLCRAGATW